VKFGQNEAKFEIIVLNPGSWVNAVSKILGYTFRTDYANKQLQFILVLLCLYQI